MEQKNDRSFKTGSIRTMDVEVGSFEVKKKSLSKILVLPRLTITEPCASGCGRSDFGRRKKH